MRGAALIMVGSLIATGAWAQDSFGGGQPAPPPRPTQQQPQPQPPTRDVNQGQAANPELDRLMALERQDFGVAPTAALHDGPMHAPTPSSIPGGQVITTKGLLPLLGNPQFKPVLLDILGGPEMIPGAMNAVPASQPGSFNDQTQQEFGRFLQQVTQGNQDTPIVLYCLSNHCWMSYNASLRAINLGYRNVLWYRGGIEAWKAAGQQVQRR